MREGPDASGATHRHRKLTQTEVRTAETRQNRERADRDRAKPCDGTAQCRLYRYHSGQTDCDSPLNPRLHQRPAPE